MAEIEQAEIRRLLARLKDAEDRNHDLRDALRTLADHHHHTKVASKLHDPKNQDWTDCPCLTCRGAKEALDA